MMVVSAGVKVRGLGVRLPETRGMPGGLVSAEVGRKC
jgi:hypothetical protein